METLRKRRDKWQVQFRKDGHNVSKTFQLREYAQRWARKHEQLIDPGEALPSTLVVGGDCLTVRELLDIIYATPLQAFVK